MKGAAFDLTPGGILLLAVLYFLGDVQIFAALLLSAAIHEWGHGAALKLCGCRVTRVRLDGTGLCMDYRGPRLSRPKAFFVAAAGPVEGALGAWVTSFWGNWFGSPFLLLCAGTGLILTVFNLLPARPLDGWRMLTALCPPLAEPVSFAAALTVMTAGLWCAARGAGIGLAVIGVILLWQGSGEDARLPHTRKNRVA